MKKLNIISLIIIFLVSFLSINDVKVNAETDYDIEQIIEDLINWKKADTGVTKDDNLLNDNLLSLAGTTPGDWYPFGLGRYNYEDNYNAYLAVINDNVNERYNTKQKLHNAKATEWHRISLAISACGGDPTHIIDSDDGSIIDLIADGTYNRGKTVSVGRQGINGWIWGLIALDSKHYEVPADAFNTRQDFIVEIIKNQLADGGFALAGTKSDPDITAMAIQALSSYYNSEIIYEYTSTKLKDENNNYIKFNKSVKQVIDESLVYLSEAQLETGDYASWNMANVESTAQVIVALNCLGIDLYTDERFIKNGHNLIDGIMIYHLDNGGFVHSFVYDPDNPSADPNLANTMAGEQVLYSLVSLYRSKNKMRSLYDLLPEFSNEERTLIDTVINLISTLNDTSTKDDVKVVMNEFNKVPATSRRYITNYWNLSKYLKKFNFELPKEDIIFSGNESDSEDIILYFTEENKKDILSLPSIDKLSTEYYVKVTNLRYLLNNCEDFEEKKAYIILIDKAYNKIAELQEEINSIEDAILNEINPISKIGLSDKKLVNSLLERYNNLEAYDQAKIIHIEDLNKAQAKIETTETIIIATVIVVLVAGISLTFIILNIKKRRKAKLAKLMPESDE